MSHTKRTKSDKRMDAIRHQLGQRCRELGIAADVSEVGGEPAIIIGKGVTGAIALDRALRIVEMRMKAPAHAVWPAPTPERRAKASGKIVEIEVRPGQPAAHAVQWTVDAMRRSLSEDEHDAATALYEAYFTLHRSSGVTNYLGTGGGSRGGQRLELSERQEMAGRLVEEMRDRVLQTIGPDCWDCARTFILELPMRAGDPRPLTWAEFGRLHGNPRDDHAAVCIAKTAFKHTCAVLASVIRDRGQVRKRRA